MIHIKPEKYFSIALLIVSSLALQSAGLCSTTAVSPTGICVTVDAASGSYAISTNSPHWTLSGKFGANISHVATTTGRNLLGNYQEIDFDWEANAPLKGRIRNYENRQAVMFSVTAVKNTNGPLPDFPAFTAIPSGLRSMSFQDTFFSPVSFKPQNNSTPWFFFDTAGNTFALSPASNFLVSQMHGDGVSLIGSGLENALVGEPAGFTHDSVFVEGQGIRNTVLAWGKVLTDLSGKTWPKDDVDQVVKYLGFWTDNGGDYWYRYDRKLGYANTLIDQISRLHGAEVPVRYLQLDSWWYQKSYTWFDNTVIDSKNSDLPKASWNTYGGTINYSASPDLFPNGLEAFHKQVGVDFVVHNRWIDPFGPYRDQYKMAGVAIIDPKWWSDRMAYLKANGIMCYEQDWLNEIYAHSPLMHTNPYAGEEFTDNMAKYAAANGISLQYCMASPRFFLQGSKYQNLTNIRTSVDRFEPARYQDFVYCTLFAQALHARSFSDVFFSGERNNLVAATLSAGPVGFGDDFAKLDRINIMRCARQDGVLIRPDLPLTPTDSTIYGDAENSKTPLVATAAVDNGIRTTYVFCYVREHDSGLVQLTPKSLGCSGKSLIYNIETKEAVLADEGALIQKTLKQKDWTAFAIAPVDESGIALIGDENKITGMGRARIASAAQIQKGVTAQIVFSVGENNISLTGYSASPISVQAANGNARVISYDSTSGIFHIEVSRTPLTKISNDGTDPVSLVTISIESKA